MALEKNLEEKLHRAKLEILKTYGHTAACTVHIVLASIVTS